ncbi:MAG: hypothetical protein JWN47_794 [Frankiales bacterium]|nr:hypothetical protein [Frankiales bacterium]
MTVMAPASDLSRDPVLRRTVTGPADARELATSPVADPYRGQLTDPFYEQPVPDDVALFVPRGTGPAAVARPARRPALLQVHRQTPGIVVTVGVAAIVLGVLIAVLGLLVIAVINISNNLDGGDRSFYRGQDATYVLLGVLDFGIAVALIGGAIAVMSGKITGRIALTAANWAVVGLSVYWWRQPSVPPFIPIALGLVALASLIALYQASITRWLGVLPAAQPE